MITNETKSETDVSLPTTHKLASVTCEVPDNCYLAGIKLRIDLDDPGATIRMYSRTELLNSATYELRISAFVKESISRSVELNLTFDGVMDAIQLLNEMRDHILDTKIDGDRLED